MHTFHEFISAKPTKVHVCKQKCDVAGKLNELSDDLGKIMHYIHKMLYVYKMNYCDNFTLC